MEFPVDVLASVSQEALEKSAQDYMNGLLYVNPDSPQQLTLDNSTQVPIGLPNVGFVPFCGANNKKKVLALFSPGDQFTAVGLYLLDRWWTIEDILKTSDPSRDGAVEVETIGERIVLYILNRVVYRAKEMSTDEPPFLCHEDSDYAKILWKHGEAVGFYSVKPSGSLCRNFLTQRYQLPVMDSIFVRKCHRGNSFGLQMLENFVDSFKEDCLGLRYPISKTMYQVCAKYLSLYPADKDLFWEVESVGGPSQRTNIANKIQAMDLSALSKNLSFSEQSSLNREMTENDVVMEEMSTCIQGREAMKCTVEVAEEINLMSHANDAKDIDETPVTARGRSSGLKRRKIREETGLSDESKSEKVIRIEEIEAEVDTPKEESVIGKQQEKETEGMESGVTDGQTVHDLNKEEAAGDAVATVIEGSRDKEMEDRSSFGESEKTVTATTMVTPEGSQELTLKLQRATVVLVDVNRTTYQTQVEVENVASEMLQMSENEGPVEVAGPDVVEDMDENFEEEKREIMMEEEITEKESKREEAKIEEENQRNRTHRSSHLPNKPVYVQAESDVQTPRKSSRSAAKALEAPQERSLVTNTKEVKETVRRKSQRHQNKAEEEEQRKEANETPKSKARQSSKSLKTKIEEEKAELLIQKRVLRGRTSIIAKHTPGKYTRSHLVETVNEEEIALTVKGQEEEKVEKLETTTKGTQDETEDPALEEKKAEQDQVQSVILKMENEEQQEETVVLEEHHQQPIEDGESMNADKSAPENKDQMETENQGEKTVKEITVEKDSLRNQTEEIERTPEPAIGDKVGGEDQIEMEADNLKEDAEEIVPVGQEGAIDSNKLVEEERPPVVQKRGLGGRAKATKATPKHKSTQQSHKVQLQQSEPEHEEEQKVVEEDVTEHKEEHALVTGKPTHEEESKDKEAKETTAEKDASTTRDKIVEEENDKEEKLEEKTTPDTKKIVAGAVEERDLTEKESVEKVNEETEDFEGKPEDEEDEKMLEKQTVVEESAEEVEVENTEPYNEAIGIVEGVVDEVIKKTSEELLEIAKEPTVEEVVERKLLDEMVEKAVEETAEVEEGSKVEEKEEAEPVAETVEEATAETAEIQVEPKLEEQKELEPVDEAVQKPTEETAGKQMSPGEVEEAEISEEEEEPSAVKTRALRRGRKSMKATPKRKSTQRGKKQEQHEEKEEETETEKSAEEDEEAPVLGIRDLRRGRKAVSVRPRRKSNRVRTQPQEKTEEETVVEEAATAKEEEIVEKQKDTKEKIEEVTPEEKSMDDVEAIEEGKKTVEKNMEEETVDKEIQTGVQKVEETVAEEPAAVEETEETEEPNKIAAMVESVEDEIIEKTSEDMADVVEEPTLEEEKEIEPVDEVVEKAVEETAEVEEEPKENEEAAPVAEMVEEAIVEMAEIHKETKIGEQNKLEPVDEAVEKLNEETADKQISPAEVEEVEISVEEEEAPAVKTRALRRGRKSVKATPKRKSTQRGKKLEQHEEKEEEAETEKSAEEDEEAPVIEIRVLRRGRKPAPVTPRRKSKRARKQQEEDEEEEETVEQEAATAKEEVVKSERDSVKHNLTTEEIMAAEENQVDEEEVVERGKGKEEAVVVGEERVDFAKSVFEVEEEGKIEEAAAETAQFEVKKLGEETKVEVNTEVQITSDSQEIEVGISEEEDQERKKKGAKENEDCILEKDEKDVIIAQNTPGDSMEQNTEKPPVNKETEEGEAPVVEEPAEEEENTEEVEDSVEEKRKEIEPEEDDVVIIEEPQEEANKPETILAEKQGIEAEVKDPEDTSEIAEAEEVDDKVQEKAAEEEAAESEETVEEEKPPEVETRALRSKTKTAAAMSGRKSKRHSSEEEEEEVEPPKRRSTRRRPSIDYNEQVGEEEEASGTELEEEKESKKVVKEEIKVEETEEKEAAESEVDDETENLGENTADEVEENIGETSLEAEAEDGVEDKITLELEEEEEEDKEEEKTSEEEEVEAPVVGKRNLRGRSIATPIATPARGSKTVTQKYKVENDEPEDVSSDEEPEQSPHFVTKRRLRKRKSTEPAPIRRSKRRSRT